jgi:hypothetical protein
VRERATPRNANGLELLRSRKIAVFRAQDGRPVDFTAEDIGALEEQLAEIDDLPAKDS